MSLETIYLQKELAKLDTAQGLVKSSEKLLRSQILALEFLTDYVEFETVLSDFENSVVTLVETVQNPVAGLPEATALALEEGKEEKSESTFSYPKAIVLVAVIVMTTVIAIYQLISPMVPVYVAVGCACLAFFPQLISFIRSVLHKDDEKTPELLEDWIADSLQKIRSLYTSARFLTKVQNQTKEELPNYALLNIDQALYDRKQHFSELLPSEFLGRIGKIVVACDRNIWMRKAQVISAISIAQQSSKM